MASPAWYHDTVNCMSRVVCGAQRRKTVEVRIKVDATVPAICSCSGWQLKVPVTPTPLGHSEQRWNNTERHCSKFLWRICLVRSIECKGMDAEVRDCHTKDLD